MVRLESYSSLTRKQEDLFKKNYCYTSFALATFSHQTSDLLFKTRVAKQFKGPVKFNLSGAFKHGDFTFTPKQKTDGSQLLAFDFTPDRDNKLRGELKLVTEAGAVKSQEPTLSVEHSRDNARVKLALTSDLSAKFTGTFGQTDLGFGVETKVPLNAVAAPVLNVAGWYNHSRTNSVFKAEGLDLATRTVSKLSASTYLDISPSVKAGSLITFDLKEKAVSTTFGAEYQLSDKTLLKGKLDNAGTVGVALQQSLSSHVKLGVASQVETAKVVSGSNSDFKFGFRLDFTD
jgi:hypothetical protein